MAVGAGSWWQDGGMCCGYDHRLDAMFERVLESEREMRRTLPARWAYRIGQAMGWLRRLWS